LGLAGDGDLSWDAAGPVVDGSTGATGALPTSAAAFAAANETAICTAEASPGRAISTPAPRGPLPEPLETRLRSLSICPCCKV